MEPSVSRTFEGKVALVTGAGSGPGGAPARPPAAEGGRIVVADIDVAAGQETVDLIALAGGDAVCQRADVARAGDVQAMVDRAMGAYGRLDCAVNNAGIETESAPTAECTEENWDRTLAVNLKGVWLCMKYEIPRMLERGGSIVNTSSVYGLIGCPGGVAYAASKHGINGMTKTTALEYATARIRVNSVCPGAIQTPMIDRLAANQQDYQQRLVATEPVGRMATPDEVAAAIVWLCSDAASFVTGIEMPVDGGWVAR